MTIKPSGPGAISLPRETVLASAGTGKTYTLSSRLIGLLAAGAEPDAILASTFTRKAAGEILARVLTRLAHGALSPEAAGILSRDITLPDGPTVQLDTQDFSDLLRKLVRNIHRANVGTLDALLIRMAGSFSSNLGLPPEWSIGDEPTSRRIEAEALQRVLTRAGVAETAELVRMTMRGESGRGVHQRLLTQLLEVRALVLQRDLPDPEELWAPPDPLRFDDGPPRESGFLWEELLEAMATIPLPTGASGKPDGHFKNALARGVEHLAGREWEKYCRTGLGGKVLAGETTFYRKPIPPEIQEVVQRALEGVAQEVRSGLADQSRALRALATGFHDEMAGLKQREGSYRFSDITLLLATADPLANHQDLWYRLDQKAHHILLDEFQDTSRPQWEALFPLVTEVLSGTAEERSALMVADPKQSIYGWRGAEPDMAARIAHRYDLAPSTLDKSYRSAACVLDSVNAVFGSLPENPVFGLREDAQSAAEAWGRGFKTHRAAKDLEGYVRMEAGPPKPLSTRSDRPEFMAWAARRIADLHRAAPGATLGVLVRRNAAVSRIIGTLRGMGVEVSEEGAGTVADSPAVAACLALLRMADHPGDRLASYHAARSPLGPVVGLDDPDDTVRRKATALEIRGGLLSDGYPAVLEAWIQGLLRAGPMDGRERGRLNQLLELAYRWEGRTSLRPTDFVRWVESESVEAPSDAMLRVMTVHQAKGLEFDVVVLPELHLELATGRGIHQAILPLKDFETGSLLRIFPNLPKDLRPLFPDLALAGRQDRRAELHDALGVAYVAMTRARHALHLLVESDHPDRESKLAFTFACLIQAGLGIDGVDLGEGDVLFESGNPTWAEEVDRFVTAPKRTPHTGSTLLDGAGAPAEPRPRVRFRPQRSPSALVRDDGPNLGSLLATGSGEGRRVGTIVHEWLETLSWLEDWAPDPNVLFRLGRRVVPNLSREESDALFNELSGWMESEEIGSCLTRASYPEGSEVLTEEPFAIKWKDAVFQGRVDRIVLLKRDGELLGAEVLDYKTDTVHPAQGGHFAEAEARYRPQLDAYRRAVGARFGLSPAQVSGGLIFLRPGTVRRLPQGDIETA
jgi:ATP-dependent exoDNAse (exonuclease V) beta subunit